MRGAAVSIRRSTCSIPGAFGENRYFDVDIVYAKANPSEIHIRIIATNRGPEAAELHLLPTLWFRNTWSWADGAEKPLIRAIDPPAGAAWAVEASHPEAGGHWLYGRQAARAAVHRQRDQ